MNRIIACLALLSLAACNTSQLFEESKPNLTTEELQALLIGNVVVLEKGAQLSYAADGIYEWKTESEHDRGVYAIRNDKVCVRFDDGNARCDHFEKRDEGYVVVDKNNQTGVIASIERIDVKETAIE